MIIKGLGRTDGRQLAAYMGDYDRDYEEEKTLSKYLQHEKNEKVTVLEVKGSAYSDLDRAIRGWEAEAVGGKCKRPLWHAQMRTPHGENLTRAQKLEAVDILERHLGLDNQPRAVVIHTKDGHEHLHIAWSRIRRTEATVTTSRRVGKRDKSKKVDDRPLKTTTHIMAAGTAIADNHTYKKNCAASKEIRERFGLQHLDSPTFEKTGTREDRREHSKKAASSHKEYQSAKRADLDPRERKRVITALWQQTDSGKSLRGALQDAGYVLAMGSSRTFVLVDRAGEIHSLARQVQRKDVRAADVRQRLSDLDLASVPKAAHITQQLRQAWKERQVEVNAAAAETFAPCTASPRQEPSPVLTQSDPAKAPLEPEKDSLEPSFILAGLTRNNSTFTRTDLRRTIAKRLQKKDGVAFETDITRTAKAVRNLPDLIVLGQDRVERPRFTSKDIFETERRMDAAAETLASRKGHIVSNAVKAAVPGYSELSEQQRSFADHLLADTGLALGRGYAGSGKSFTAKVVHKAVVASGGRIRGLAVAGIAAESLQAGSSIPSQTLQSFFMQQDLIPQLEAQIDDMTKRASQLTGNSYGQRKARFEMTAKRDMFSARIDTMRVTSKDTILLDEAGMVGSRQMEKLLTIAQKSGAKVMMIGDAEQLQAIEAGGAFRALTDRHGAAKLSEIRRQNKDWAKAATEDFGDGFSQEALTAYAARGHIKEHTDHESARRQVIRDWTDSRHVHIDQKHIMVAYTRKDVATLNEQGRAAYKAEGRLGVSVSVNKKDGPMDLAVGDRFYFLENRKLSRPGQRERVQVKNGTLGTVEQIEAFATSHEHRITVKLDNGATAQFSTGDYTNFNHGYAATIHKSQGVTAGQAFVLASKYMDRHASYVAMSRHIDNSTMYYSNTEFPKLDDLFWNLTRDGRKDTTLDYAPRTPDFMAKSTAAPAAKPNAVAQLKEVLSSYVNPQARADYKKKLAEDAEIKNMRNLLSKPKHRTPSRGMRGPSL